MYLHMDAQITFRRRIGTDPHANGVECAACDNCPDIWELDDGSFAIIGMDITDAVRAQLPATAGCGPDERIVRLPRTVLVNARQDIPNKV